LYPFKGKGEAKAMKASNSVNDWIIRAIEDPLTKILMENSNLTKIQLETILIDFLVEDQTGNYITYEEKAKLRKKEQGVSRGAFNRTLKQARANVIHSIYTIILLGYLGIFDTPKLAGFLELADRLKTYADAYREIWTKAQTGQVNEHEINAINKLKNDLKSMLDALAQPLSLSRRM
jgi:hypothetical protein